MPVTGAVRAVHQLPLNIRSAGGACDKIYSSRSALLIQIQIDGIPGLPKLPSGKHCGAVGVTNYLKEATNDKEALALVYRAYIKCYSCRARRNAWDGSVFYDDAKGMLLEQARLLWMRRERGQDVLDFLKEVNA